MITPSVIWAVEELDSVEWDDWKTIAYFVDVEKAKTYVSIKTDLALLKYNKTASEYHEHYLSNIKAYNNGSSPKITPQEAPDTLEEFPLNEQPYRITPLALFDDLV